MAVSTQVDTSSIELESDRLLNELDTAVLLKEARTPLSVAALPPVRSKSSQVTRCSICHRNYFNSGNLLRHMRTQHKDCDVPAMKPRKGIALSSAYRCPCCEKVFGTGSNLLKHAKKNHSGVELKKTKVHLLSDKMRPVYKAVFSDDYHTPLAKVMLSELENRLLLIADRIKLMKRQLRELGQKKAQLVHEIEQLTHEEHELQEQLVQETSEQSLLTQRVKEMVKRGKQVIQLDGSQEEIGEIKEVLDPAVQQGDAGLAADSEDCCTTDIDVKRSFRNASVNINFVAELAVHSERQKSNRKPASCRSRLAKTRGTAGRRMVKEFEISELCEVPANSIRATEAKVLNIEVNAAELPVTIAEAVMALRCPKCGREFKHKYRLSRHAARCGDVKPFECTQCDKHFTTKYILKLHHRVHAGDFPDLCSVCGKGFVDIGTLKKHMENHVKEYGCNVCWKYFPRRAELRIHQRRHTGERPYVCAVCGRSYPSSSELRYHLPMHNDVKEHVCGVCQRAFHHGRAYHDHLRTHTGETPFACHLCSLRFTSKYRLTKHQFTAHSADGSEVPRLTCAICGKAFCALGTLRAHQRSHSSDKPHQCQLCDKQYKNVYDLVLHCRRKHGSAPGSQGE